MLSGSAYAYPFEDKENLTTTFEWEYLSTNPYRIALEITNYSKRRERLYTKFRIFSNCEINGKKNEDMELQEIIDLKDIVLQPYQTKIIYISSKFKKKDNTCADLAYKKSEFYRLFDPDPCINEKNFISKSLCKAKNKEWTLFESDKISRGEAADKCSRKSESRPKEVRSQYYKDCMKAEGY